MANVKAHLGLPGSINEYEKDVENPSFGEWSNSSEGGFSTSMLV
jgi:hypothetical protein